MPRKNLTARFVETVKVETRTDLWDDIIKGLILRVSPTGVKSWSVVYTRESDGSRQRVTIGQFPAVGLEKARAKALATLTDISNGGDPASKKKIRREAMTVRELGAAFIEQYAKREKRTWAEDQRILDVEVYPAIGNMKAMMARRRDWMDVIDAKVEAGRAGQARKIMSMVRKMLNWAVEKDLLEVNPIAGVKAPGKPGKKDRFLNAIEIKTMLEGLETAALLEVTKDVLRLLLLTGQRSGEVCGMVRAEIDPDAGVWYIPAARAKNGVANAVHLSDPALAIVRRALDRAEEGKTAPLFSRVGKPIHPGGIAHAVKNELQLFEQPWTPHDLRRTVATGMGEIGVEPHIIEATLNHISGFKGGVAGVYNRASYEPQKQAALDKWARHIERVTSGQIDNVVLLRRA
jgi:integrase